MKPEQEWSIRRASGNDLNFIYDTWLNSYKHDSLFGKIFRTGFFFDEYRYVIDSILANPTTTILIACLPQSPEVILGYLVCNKTHLDYCFVKDAFRNLGIAKSLVNNAYKTTTTPHVITHKTSTLGRVLPIGKYDLEYNPFILFKTHKELK